MKSRTLKITSNGLRKTKVFLGEEEISSVVRDVEISIGVDHIPVVKLTVLAELDLNLDLFADIETDRRSIVGGKPLKTP